MGSISLQLGRLARGMHWSLDTYKALMAELSNLNQLKMRLSTLFATLLCASALFPQAPAKSQGTTTVAIQSTAICDMCERTIEENLVYEKGVKKVDVDLSTAAVNVTFAPRKTDAAKLRTALTELGYSADGAPADAAAFAKLPMCCQNEGCG